MEERNEKLTGRAAEFERFCEVIAILRGENGCSWDRAQTHESLKQTLMEESAEVLCGINILSRTGDPENLKEELGDLLMQVVFHAQLAEEEGLFSMEDVIRGIRDKMIRRHPHVFAGADEASVSWEEIKRKEKAGKEWMEDYLPEAIREGKRLLERAEERKGFPTEG
jgi:uncharacterized protein YabN with tetrapyrrole methylase and pyrophosphatase domain